MDYGYDPLGRLTNVTAFAAGATISLGGKTAFTYDIIGNALTRHDTTISGVYGSAARSRMRSTVTISSSPRP